MGKLRRFITNGVFLLIASGLIVLIAAESHFLHFIMPSWFDRDSKFDAILKTIGGSLLGSGVFTAVIKSSAYATVFSDILYKIIWTPEYVKQRGDQIDMWNMLSKTIYEEKFPAISDEINSIVSNKYFPIDHDAYIENFDVTVDICDHYENAEYWIQNETVTFTVKPVEKDKPFPYEPYGDIEKPNTGIENDLTSFKTSELSVNGVDIEVTPSVEAITTNDRRVESRLRIHLSGSEDYFIRLKREKIVFKKTNTEKRFNAKLIIKGLKVKLVANQNLEYSFFQTGTTEDFSTEETLIYAPVQIASWTYPGVILPAQGYIMVFR